MLKFNRKYLLAIQYGEEKGTRIDTLETGEKQERVFYSEGKSQVVIRPFFTIRFTIDRGIYASINKLTLDIYNLGKTTREKIYYDGILHAAVYKRIVLYAGYSNEDFSKFDEPIISNNIKNSINGLPLVFCGRFTRAYSYRQGTEFITHIEAFDLPEKNEVELAKEFHFNKGDTEKAILYKLADDLNISRENVRIAPDFKFELTRDKYFYKQTTWDAVNEMVNSYNDLLIQKYGKNTALFRLYYDYPILSIQRDDEYYQGYATTINSDTGLLSTPIRENAKVTFKTLFEPSFRCGGYVYLDSRTTQTGIGGLLKVVGFKHQGTISPVVSETLTTDFTCFMGIEDGLKGTF